MRLQARATMSEGQYTCQWKLGLPRRAHFTCPCTQTVINSTVKLELDTFWPAGFQLYFTLGSILLLHQTQTLPKWPQFCAGTSKSCAGQELLKKNGSLEHCPCALEHRRLTLDKNSLRKTGRWKAALRRWNMRWTRSPREKWVAGKLPSGAGKSRSRAGKQIPEKNGLLESSPFGVIKL